MATEKEVPVGRGTKNLGDSSAGASTSSPPPTKSLPVTQGGIDSGQADAAAQASQTAGATKAAGSAAMARKAGLSSTSSPAGDATRQAVQAGVSGNGQSTTRNATGRYVGAAAAGGVDGAAQGGLHGAAAGAAKEVALEAGKDAVKEMGKGEQSKVLRGGVMAAPVAAAPQISTVLILAAIFQWMKTLFFAAMAMVANLGKLLWNFLIGAAKAIGHAIAAPFLAVGGFLAKGASAAFGVGAAAATPVMAVLSGIGATAGLVAMVGSLLGGASSDTVARNDGLVAQPCVVDASTNQGGDGTDFPITESVEANAKRVYSVFKTWGMSDANIAGILGNWSEESGIDPTSVESIFTEPYRIGPRKQAAWDGNFTHIPGQAHGGIGLGQWSNDRTPMLLDYAESKGIQWYTIEAQLAFMVQGDNPSDAAVVRDMVTTSQPSPGDAAIHFHHNWERSADNAQGLAERRAAADSWYGRMSGWTVDPAVADQVEDITGDLTEGVSMPVSGSAVTDKCGGTADANFAGLTDGGLTEEQAQQLVDLYNSEGHQFLMNKYNGGGPGQCNGNYVQNCVSFSAYWYNKYTTFDQYAPGNGVATARSLASMTGKTVTRTPTAYSVFSGPGSGPAGHTGVVLSVQGDRILIGEAAYCAFEGRVRWLDKSQWSIYEFVDMSDMIKSGSPAA